MDYKKGYDLTIDNARSLLDISEKAAESKNFGLACSLNILAAEETIKAFCLSWVKYNGDMLKELSKIFRDHKIKHKHLQGLLVYSVILKKSTEKALASSKKDWLEIRQKTKENYARDIDMIIEHQEKDEINQLLRNPPFDNENMSNWLKEVNDKRNNGLYINIQNEEWVSPIFCTESSYLIERQYSLSILNYVVNFEKYLLSLKKVRDKVNKINQP